MEWQNVREEPADLHLVDAAHSDRMRLIGRMATRLVHELCQPLTAIAANTETARILLREPGVEASTLLEAIEDICACGEQAGHLVGRLRDFLTKHETCHEAVSPSRIVHGAVSLTNGVLDERQIALTVQCQANLPTVRCDRVLLQQVLVNLVLNAADALMGLPQGERRILLRARFLEPLIEITVKDNGQGIEPGVFSKVFHSEASTRRGGMGLSMSLCAEIVKAHAGAISAENNGDGGATIRVVLPAQVEPDESQDPASHASEGPRAPLSDAQARRAAMFVTLNRADLMSRQLRLELLLVQANIAMSFLDVATTLNTESERRNIDLARDAISQLHRSIEQLAADTGRVAFQNP